MPEFKPGDRVRYKHGGYAGKVISTRFVPEFGHTEVFVELTHREPDGPWVVINHSRHFPGHVDGRTVADAWDTNLEHLD